MTNNGYRSTEGSPEYLSSAYWDKRITDTLGKETMATLFFARQAYFMREGSREEIASTLPKCVLVHFYDFCDRVDAYDDDWIRKGQKFKQHRDGKKDWSSAKFASPAAANSHDADVSVLGAKFHPPQTAAERQQFVRTVEGFAEENGFANFDAESFVHSLEVNGWKTVRGTVLVCWKQAAKKWHQYHHETDNAETLAETKEVIQDQTTAQSSSASLMPEANKVAVATEDVEECITITGQESNYSEQTPDKSVADNVHRPLSAEQSETEKRSSEVSTQQAMTPTADSVPEMQSPDFRQNCKCKTALPEDPHAIFDPMGCMVLGSDIPCLNHCVQVAGGRISQRDYDLLLSFTESFGDDMIIRAADLAKENARYNRIGYIRKTLWNWQQEGKYTLASLSLTQTNSYYPRYPQRPIASSAAEERARWSIEELKKRYGSEQQADTSSQAGLAVDVLTVQ